MSKERLLTDSEPLRLITDDSFDHPIYPNKTRLKVIPDWDLLYTHQQNRCREIAEAQAIFTRQATLREVGEWLDDLAGKCNIGITSHDSDGLDQYNSRFTNEVSIVIAKLKQGEMPQ